MKPRILLAVPCYNEAANIGALLDEIAALGQPYDVLVVDDGSTDGTFEAARGKARCLRLSANLGIGGAVQTAVIYAHRRGYDFCIQIDGDGQHPPSEIASLLAAHAAAPAALTIGSRFLGEERYAQSRLRRWGAGVIRRAIAWLWGREITDPTSGMRLMDRRAIALFAGDYPDDFPEPISIARALEKGLAVRETAVRMRPRRGGQSSIRGLATAAYVCRVLGYLLLIRLGRFYR